MANHANKKASDVEKFSGVFFTAKKISQHPLAYGKLTLRTTIKRNFWQLIVPAAQS
ncbi:hypothetical protein TUM20903_32820 [Citrobacter koseri]|nr:hypothetical protein TUM13189_33030 [Citrobacter koseri]BDG90544.1 hypothetical protein TUM20903_32820 [Citrobacter koseri]